MRVARKAGKGRKKSPSRGARLYTLRVSLISGPMTEAFVKQNPQVCRTIQIRGNQTLARLHDAIFEAYDREEEHMFEFQFGEAPHHPDNKRYVLPLPMQPLFEDDESAGDVTRTKIDSLGLQVDQSFGYWFDFGDDWWHQIDVVSIDDEAPKGNYPKVTERIGESPPQYIDWDEEGEWEDPPDEEP